MPPNFKGATARNKFVYFLFDEVGIVAISTQGWPRAAPLLPGIIAGV